MTSLSDQERAYWIDWQRDPKSTAYVLALAGERKAPFDRKALGERLTKAIRSHASLRTLYTSRGETVLLEDDRARVEIESIPFGGGDREDTALVTRSLQAFAFRPFALDADLLVRAGVMTLPGGGEVLVLAAHHAALDYVAMRLLWNEISGNVELSGAESDRATEVTAATTVAGDVVRAERPRDRAYWMRTLAGGWPSLDLGGARSRRGLGGLLRDERALTSSITAKLRTRAREEGVSVSSLVLLAWGQILMEAGAANEVTVGLLSNMRRSRAANAIGSFVNTLPIRFQRGATPREVHTAVLGGLAHRHVSLGEIAASMAHEGGAALQATYNYFAGDPGVVLAGIGRRGGSLPFEGGELRTVAAPPIHAHSELSLLVGDVGDELLLTIDVSTAMYPRALLRTLGSRLEARLLDLAANRVAHSSPLQSVHVFAPFTADPVAEPLRFLLRQAEVLRRVHVHAPAEFFPTLLSGGFPAQGEIVLLLEGREEALRNAPLLIEAIGKLAPRSPVVIVLPRAAGESGEARRALIRGIEAVGVPPWDIDFDVSSYDVSRIFEPAAEAHAQIPYTDEMFAVMSLRIARVVRAGLQPPMKVIAVDGDETLWRGVVGEVGAEGISFEGAPRIVQQFLQERRRDGFLLSLVSKNVEADARAALLHPDSILRWEDFAAHRVGWSEKSDSLVEIAAELNAGLDAFVFLDDSAAECERMRLALPEVEVVELRGDARQRQVRLSTDWHFDLPPSTAVDARRTEMLAEERARQQVRAHVSTLDELVAALKVEVSISPMLDTEVARVAQLTQRTNQFNTTTQRCSEAEVRARKNTWVVRVTDRFGDYGLAGAMVIVPSDDPRKVRIDAWMLSCRVLGRGVERAFVRWLRERGVERFVIPYATTLRNVPAMQLLERMAEAPLPPVGEVDVLLTDSLEQRLSMIVSREASVVPVRANPSASSKDTGGMPSTASQEPPLTLPRFDSARALLEAIRGPLRALGDAERPSGFAGEVFDVWREAVGEPPSVTRSFFAQGGTSLAAVQMLVQLERRTGLRCDLAMLFAHPTFAEFAEHAERRFSRHSDTSLQPADALSATELAVFAFMQRSPSSLAYHVPLLMEVVGSLDLADLSSAWKAIVSAQPALRTLFKLGPKGPSREVTELDVPLRITEPLDHDVWLLSRLSEPFDVSLAPLCRLEFATTPRGTYLLLVAHHLVIDGPSLERLGALLVEQMGPAARKAPLPHGHQGETNLPQAYPVHEVREVRARGVIRTDSTASPDRDPDLFAAWTPKGAAPSKLLRVTRALPISRVLQEQARENGTTPFALLASALAWTLFALRGASRVGFGTIMQRSIGSELGLHGELIALPFAFPEAAEFQGALGVLCRQATDALGACAPAASAEVVFVEEASPAPLSIGAAHLRFVDTPPLEPQFAARFFARAEGEEGVVLGLDVDTGRFSRGEAESALARWAQVIESIGQRAFPSMMLPGEEHALLQLGRGEEVIYPWQGGVVAAWFAAIDGSGNAEKDRVPRDAIALVGDRSWSYAELASRVGAVAEALRASGVKRGDRVGVCMQRSEGLVTALHGVVAAGAAYVALEPELPGERLAWMANNAGCRRVLCDDAGEATLLAAGFPLDQLLKWESVSTNTAPGFVPESMGPDDLMYVLYTSGSTGRPKGVEVTHGGVWNRLMWQRDAFRANRAEVVLQKTPFGFDVSVWELFWPMLLGGRLVVLAAGEHRDPEAVITRVRKENVTTLHFVPSMLRVFLDWEGVETLHTLRRVVCSGEALRPGDVVRLRARLPNVDIWNLYGPTEASVDVTWWKAPDALPEVFEVPIGRPVSNTELYVLAPSGKLALRGAVGELVIAGAQVARGYAANPEETDAKFYEFNSGARAYRTGDQVRWSEGGELLYLGRLDGQVKVRGQRVELGEIESSLEQHLAVQAAACVIDAEHSRITAFVVLREKCSPSDLRAYLATRLSEAMRPTSIVPVESLPLGPSGKIDRARLGSLEPTLAKIEETPASEKERQLAAAFAAVLGLQEVPLEESFFALGGDSLSAMRLVVAARARGLRLQVAMLYEAPSVRALAKIAVAPSEETETLSALPELPMARWFRERARQDELYLQIVRVQFDAPVPLERLEAALTALCQHHQALSLPFGSGRRGMGLVKADARGSDDVALENECASMIGPEEAGVFIITCEPSNTTESALPAPATSTSEAPPAPTTEAPPTSTIAAQALTIAARHEVIDGYSWHVLLSDLSECLAGNVASRGSEMGRAAAAFEAWRDSPSAEDRREAARTLLRALPPDAWELGEAKHVSTHRVTLALPRSRNTVELEAVESLLLAALTSALSEYGEGPCVIGVEGHGRDSAWAESLDLTGEIGWFSSLDPVLIEREKWADTSVARARAALDARVNDWLSLELDREFPSPPVCLNLLGDLSLLSPARSSAFERITFSALRPKTPLFGLEVMAWMAEQSLHVEWIGPELGFTQFEYELRKLLAAHEAESAEGARLSPAQEGIWTACERDPSRDLYVEQFSTTLSGPFSVERFTRALEETIRAQPILRTMFHERRSKVLPEEESPRVAMDALRLELQRGEMPNAGRQRGELQKYAGLPHVEPRSEGLQHAESPRLKAPGAPPESKGATFEELRANERVRGFDLSSPPLFRVLLVEKAPQEWAIAFTYHHLLLDGWSVPLVLDAILARYHKRPLPPSTVAGDRAWPMSRSRGIRYWRARLAGLRHVTAAPLPRSNGGSSVSATFVDPSLQRTIDAFARKNGTSVHTVLFGAFLRWLREAHRERRVCVAIAVSGREGPGAEERIGMWMNTLPFEASFDRTEEVGEWLLGVQRQLIRDQIYGSLGLREMLGPSLPVPEALFVYENYPKEIGVTDGLTIGAFSYARRVEFPFAMVVTPGEHMHLELLAEGIESESLDAAMNGYLDLLSRMCADELSPPTEFAERQEEAAALSKHATGRAKNLGGMGRENNATELERTIASVWSSVLGLPSLSPGADFFQSGGDSLQAAAVVGRLRKLLRRDISVRSLFDHPRLDLFVGAVRATHESTAIADEGPTRDPNGGGQVSAEQERLYFLEQLAGGEALYHLPCALRIDGPLEVEKLRHAIAGVVRRHESLRTVFGSSANGVTATILPREWADGFPIEVTTCAKDAEAIELLSQRARKPFNLSRGPLLRVVLVTLGHKTHWLGLTVHHLVADGWSIPILVREVLALYDGRDLPELPIQYSDYARWQRQRDVSAACEERWRGRMKGAPELLPLPTRRSRPKQQSFEGEHLPFELRGVTLRQLERAAREEGVTPFMWLLAVLDVLLARLSGTEDIVVGCSTAHRTTPALEPLVGFFVHLAVVRVEVSGTFRALLSEVRARVLEATEDPIPFERLVELSGVERTLSHSPVFQVNLVYQNVPPAEAEGDVKVTPALLETGTSRFDLALIVEPSRDALQGVLEFNTDVFDAPFAQLFVAAFDALLEASLAGPDTNVFALPVSAGDQRRVDVGAPRREKGEVLAETFARVAAERGDATALRIERAGVTESWSYSKLEQVSRRYALGLRARGVGPNVLVAIAKARSLETIALWVAVVRLGAAFMPIDVEIPVARATKQMEIARPALVIAGDAWMDEMPSHLNAITAEECLEGTAEDNKAQLPPSSPASAQDRAYVIFTSGSTGVPRGVNVSYEGLPNLIAEQARVFGIDANAVVLQFSSLGFDASISEVFVTLFSGAMLDLGCEDDRRNLPGALSRVTHATLPPAVLAVIDPGAYPNLRVVVSAGEALSPQIAQRWLREGRKLVNAYGPTEATVCTSMHEVRAEDLLGPVPLGAPMAGVRAVVADAQGNELPEGFAGELVVFGPSVALGYIGDRQATEERFGKARGERFYRTGDRVRSSGGLLFFLGRADEQVKLHGYRIELGEIAFVARRAPGVRDARACLSNGSLLLFVLGEGSDLASSVRASLAENVPHYMVPSRVVVLDDWPLNAHGKVDQGALLAMSPSPNEGTDEIAREPGASANGTLPIPHDAAPRNEVEAALCRLFGEVLHREVTALGSFFELGGDSIGSIQLVSRALAEGIAFGVRDVFLHPSPRELAAHAKLVTFAPLAAAPDEGEVPLTTQQRWFLSLKSEVPGHYQQAAAFIWPSCNIEALQKAVSLATARHDVLRASFHHQDGAWKQIYQPTNAVHLERIDVESIGPEGQSKEIAAFVERPFNLSEAPLLRMAVFVPKRGPLVWAVSAHHLITDAMSMRVLFEDVLRAYAEPDKPSTERIAPFASYALFDQHNTTKQQETASRQDSAKQQDTAKLDAAKEGAFQRSRQLGRPGLRGDAAVFTCEVPGVAPHRAATLVLAAVAYALAEEGWSLPIDVETTGRESGPFGRTLGWLTRRKEIHLPEEWIRRSSKDGTGGSADDGWVEQALNAASELGLSHDGAEVALNYLGRLDGALPSHAALADLRLLRGDGWVLEHPTTERPYAIECLAWMRQDRLCVQWTSSQSMRDASQRMVQSLERWMKKQAGSSEFISQDEASLALAELSERSP